MNNALHIVGKRLAGSAKYVKKGVILQDVQCYQLWLIAAHEYEPISRFLC